MSLAEIRREYQGEPLEEAVMPPNPLDFFQKWLDQAIEAKLPEPTAMTLATANRAGRPSARVVLLKDVHPDGFVFFTNYRSRKARDLAENPYACLLFYWDLLHRQVRVEGSVSRVSRDVTERYFRTRPRESQIGAWASPQSEVISDRAWLENAVSAVESRFSGEAEVPAPPEWGGYRVRPISIEFWQGRPGRLHDRLRYALDGPGRWRLERVAP